MGAFDHSNGAGFVARHDGDYSDAIKNGKANVQLLVHDGDACPMQPATFATPRVCCHRPPTRQRDGAPTTYSRSYTAKSFVPHYAQRISTACVMWGADGILKGISKQSHTNLRRATA